MAKAIMIQGTASNVGKSLLAAGLCRIFKEDGYRVAPFKAQNMALNSFITKDGLEMGRAQVMQAEAAGVEPDVWMNPILLKPTSDTGSQVIVGGKVVGTMSAKEYFRYKKSLIPYVKTAYQTLAERFEVMVLEGAGSPAEINLKQDDLVNMGMAKMAKAPVLLAGDIDCGGVFAALAGTMLLLNESERSMVKGLIINKFRGDRSILRSGEDMIEQITGVPVVGVVPYMTVDLDDEDSLAERLQRKSSAGFFDIAVIHLPRMANFTDFNPLERLEMVTVRYIKRPSQLKDADLIILPGSKNTMADLLWLKESGWAAAIIRAANKGTLILGICGGFQMLGESISDPECLECGGTMKGLGLLPIETVFGLPKRQIQVTGHFSQELSAEFAPFSGLSFTGYEIHMGQSRQSGNALPLTLSEQPSLEEMITGLCLDNVAGTYVHGLFENGEVLEALLTLLAQKKGVNPLNVQALNWVDYKENQYEQLAKILRTSLDMSKIYHILEAGI